MNISVGMERQDTAEAGTAGLWTAFLQLCRGYGVQLYRSRGRSGINTTWQKVSYQYSCGGKGTARREGIILGEQSNTHISSSFLRRSFFVKMPALTWVAPRATWYLTPRDEMSQHLLKVSTSWWKERRPQCLWGVNSKAEVGLLRTIKWSYLGTLQVNKGLNASRVL